MKQKAEKLNTQITKTLKLDYLVHIPEKAKQNPEKKWPMILFLHGAAKRGDDLNLIKQYGVPKEVENNKDFQFITISPQCPNEVIWIELLDELNALYHYALENYPVDQERIYLTGLSMGAFGSWAFATKYPEYFAAIAPVCGGSPWSLNRTDPVQSIKDIPIWVFHGAMDEIVPVQKSADMVRTLKEFGADVRLTIYPEANHDSWTLTYSNPDLYSWFLQHKRKNI